MSEIGTKQSEYHVGWPVEMDMPYEWGLSDILTFYGQKMRFFRWTKNKFEFKFMRT